MKLNEIIKITCDDGKVRNILTRHLVYYFPTKIKDRSHIGIMLTTGQSFYSKETESSFEAKLIGSD